MIKFKANTLKSMVKSIFEDQNVNQTIVDGGHDEWQGKKLCDVLNVRYYTFKHKVGTPEAQVQELLEQDDTGDLKTLDVVTKSYCLVALDEPPQRLFSKDLERIAVEGSLQFWVQTEKIQLLEQLIETANVQTVGQRFDLVLNDKQYNFIIYFGNVNVSDMAQEEFGEMIVATVDVSLIIYQNEISYSDYLIEFLLPTGEYCPVPISNITISNSMVQKSLPGAQNPACSNTLNLSSVTIFSIDFVGLKDNLVFEMFVSDSLSRAAQEGAPADINKIYTMRLTRCGQSYVYNLKMQDHKAIVKNLLESETHTIVFSTGGIN